LPGRFISAASIARLAIEIEPDVPITDPLVRRAMVSVPVGASADVMLMVPELVPSTSPILSVPVVMRLISVDFSERWLVVSVPKSTALELDLGAIVTTPPGDEVTIFADSSTSSERIFI
jgi:hypothetical protein